MKSTLTLVAYNLTNSHNSNISENSGCILLQQKCSCLLLPNNCKTCLNENPPQFPAGERTISNFQTLLHGLLKHRRILTIQIQLIWQLQLVIYTLSIICHIHNISPFTFGPLQSTKINPIAVGCCG